MYAFVSKLERGLVRIETWGLVVSLLLMLALAGYDIFYRNALMPLQAMLRTSGPPVSASPPSSDDSASAPEPRADTGRGSTSKSGFGGGFGGRDSTDSDVGTSAEPSGFQGGFGSGGETESSDETTSETSDEAGSDGFQGGFGHDNASNTSDDETTAEGFQGGFGSGGAESSSSDDETARARKAGRTAPDTSEHSSANSGSGGFGGGFAGNESHSSEPSESSEVDTESHASASTRERAPPVGGPPRPDSWAARAIEVIDALQFTWIDLLLRQMVLIVGFLGALLATRRREHITIDVAHQIASKQTRRWLDAITSFVATVVCVCLALSGWQLVQIGLKWPRELLPGLQEWVFQLIFPIGFGLMTIHFLVRCLESGWHAASGEPLAPETDGEA